jgi:creatinine amidohydrolase
MIYEIARMTHDEVAAKLAEGVDTVILPLGATENHGYHCPLSMDSISVDVVARRAADKLKCFYAPLMPYGMSANHMAFKGTMTLSPMTMATVVKELIESLAHHGFRNIIIMTAHGGNFAPIAVGAREAEQTCDCLIAVCNYYVAVKKRMDILLEQPEGTVDPQDYRSHGGTMEVSLAMAHSPEDVKLNKFVLGDVSKVLQNQSSTVQVFVSMEEYDPSGAFGHIEGASAELGRRIIELASDAVRDDVLAAIATFGRGKRGEG